MFYLYTAGVGVPLGGYKVGKMKLQYLQRYFLRGYLRWSLKFANNLVDSPLIFN